MYTSAAPGGQLLLLVLLVEYIVCALVLLVVDYSSYLLLSEAPLVCREFDCCTSPSRNQRTLNKAFMTLLESTLENNCLQNCAFELNVRFDSSRFQFFHSVFQRNVPTLTLKHCLSRTFLFSPVDSIRLISSVLQSPISLFLHTFGQYKTDTITTSVVTYSLFSDDSAVNTGVYVLQDIPFGQLFQRLKQ